MKEMNFLMVNNKAPITFKKKNGQLKFSQSNNGVVMSLKYLKASMNFKWLGAVIENELNENEKVTIKSNFWDASRVIPVFINKNVYNNFYNGYCCSVLYKLMLSTPEHIDFIEKEWQAYVKYNEAFCQLICSVIENDDFIWIHDYHFMLLPKMLRQKCKKKFKIAFSFHTPFPISEIFNQQPTGKEIIRSLLYSDFISFHSFIDKYNFMDTVKENIIDYKNFNTLYDTTEAIYNYSINEIWAKAIPIGIDPSLFTECLKKGETLKIKNKLKSKFKDKIIIIGVDRIDYVKGIPNKIQSFRIFLDKYPEYKNKVVFIQIGIPENTITSEYQKLLGIINKKVSELNSLYAKFDETIFYFSNKTVSFEELCALYSIGDVCIVSSINDGMNLVGLEYVACQEEKHGTLILSEFAKSSFTLPAAFSINPWNLQQIADSIYNAIILSYEEKKERYKININNINKFTVVKWAEDIISSTMNKY